jgi:hypothetical protein
LILMVSVSLAAIPLVLDLRDRVRQTEGTEEYTLSESVDRVVQRLQQFTAVALIAGGADDIAKRIESGATLPFYLDNQIAEKLASSDRRKSLQVYLSVRYLVDKDDVRPGSYIEDVGWYVNTGIAGWLFVLDWTIIPFYLAFVFLLIVAPYWISGRFIGARSMLPALHVAALVYVFHGWFGVQISFIVALCAYAVLVRLCGFRRRTSRRDFAGVKRIAVARRESIWREL